MSRQVGGAIGLAVLVTVAASAAADHSAAAVVHGYRIAFVVTAAVSLASVLIAALLPSRTTPERTH